MREPFKFDIFFSHSAKDKTEARPLAERLQNKRHEFLWVHLQFEKGSINR